MSSNVVEFPYDASRRVFAHRPPRAAKVVAMAPTEIIPDRPALSASVENGRLRIERREAWWMAEAAVQYWRARLEIHSAIERAQKFELPEGRGHPNSDEENRMAMVTAWRAALVRQLLTPAPDVNSVKWKQTKLASERDGYYALDVKPERIEQSIADDLAFLAAHPTRRSNSEAMARSREFKEAMRQRIRELAASRDLPDDEIKSVLRIKPQEIGEFAFKHSVSLQWLLEGAGPIFKKYEQEYDQ